MDHCCSEIGQFLGLAHLAAILIVTSTKPVSIFVDVQANPAESCCATTANHVLACLTVLYDHTATRTGSELGSHEHLQLELIISVIEAESLVPGCLGQEILQKLALFIATILLTHRSSLPRL